MTPLKKYHPCKVIEVWAEKHSGRTLSEEDGVYLAADVDAALREARRDVWEEAARRFERVALDLKHVHGFNDGHPFILRLDSEAAWARAQAAKETP